MPVIKVVILGSTGDGKSTLANVITGTDEFVENPFAASETRHHKTVQYRDRDTVIEVTDTIGVNDTGLTQQQVLLKLADTCYDLRDGFNHVLMTTTGRFTQEAILTHKLLTEVIFDPHVGNYMTVVRTKFPGYANPDKCRMDIASMMRIPGAAHIIQTTKKVLHVNNMTDCDDEVRWRQVRAENALRLRTYLATCQDVYKPRNLEMINERIESCVEEQNRSKRTLQELESIKIKSEVSWYFVATIFFRKI
eukprot:TRINITY_DN1670_c0_g1_i3.p1 TRINITY_DN1670_c0_g1~~TRINITY_DN1670_c0_g1_i3.p1  ORF type:complete len:250 (-),score=25.18 TRINITY_DN1670_c0_g1_i3:271-1020(-)